MSDDRRRELARLAGNGDLVAAQQLVGLLEREHGKPATRVAFVVKDDGGSFVWSTTARDPETTERRFRTIWPRRLDSSVTVPRVVRIRVYEDPAERGRPCFPAADLALLEDAHRRLTMGLALSPEQSRLINSLSNRPANEPTASPSSPSTPNEDNRSP